MAITTAVLDGPTISASGGATPADLATKADKTVAITGSGLVVANGTLGADFTINVPAASGAETIAGALTNKAVTPAASKAAIDAAIAALVASSPAALDTLNELAAALGNDPNFATTITNSLAAKAPLASPAFSGTPTGITKAHVGLANVDNTSDVNKPVSTAQQTALNLKAPLASPTFTGTVAGITKAMVGLGSVDNTADTAKPISTLQQTALDLKAPLASPTFTGTVAGVTKSMVGLANVDNTSDANKPVSTAQQAALNAKLDTSAFLTTLQANIQDSNIPTTGWTDPTASAVQGPSAGGKRYQRRPRVLGVRTLAHLATVADVQGGGSITGLADNTNVDALYGSTSLRLTHTGAGSLINILPAATVSPVNTTGGIIRWTFKTVANFFANADRFQIQLHSAGTPAAPTANYHEIPVGSNSELKTRLTSQNGEGRWQKVSYPVSMFTAVGTGADLTQIIFAKLVLRAASGLQIIMDIGNIEWTPNILTKAKCILTFDDGYISQYTYAAKQMAKYGFRGIAYPGALANNISTTNGTGMTPTQLKHLHDDLGWQIGSQAWLTEAPDVSVENAFTIEMAKQCNLQNALGLTGGEDGSYFSGISQYDANAFRVFRKMFRSMRVFGGGNGSGPPLIYPEMFPFADDYLVRSIDAATGGWATPAVNQQAHIDQAIAAKGVAIFAWHNQLAAGGTDRSAFDTTLAYLDANRANIDVCTIEDLYALM
jgi:peptidoglycan/xylan/chitin deacetylase (PgdA/CDA1 family)